MLQSGTKFSSATISFYATPSGFKSLSGLQSHFMPHLLDSSPCLGVDQSKSKRVSQSGTLQKRGAKNEK